MESSIQPSSTITIKKRVLSKIKFLYFPSMKYQAYSVPKVKKYCCTPFPSRKKKKTNWE